MIQNSHKYKISLIFLAILISSCQSSVRFTSKEKVGRYEYERNKIKKASQTAKKAIENFEFEDIELSRTEFSEFRSDLIKDAGNWIGVKYKYGGETKSGADCSGFVYSVFADKGIILPRVSSDQFENSEKINLNEIKAGDLVFFAEAGRINHVGIYIGEGKMIHASSSRGVVVESLSLDYFRERFAGAGRVINSIP